MFNRVFLASLHNILQEKEVHYIQISVIIKKVGEVE